MRTPIKMLLLSAMFCLSVTACKDKHDAGAADPEKTWEDNHTGEQIKTDAEAQDTTGVNDTIGQSDG